MNNKTESTNPNEQADLLDDADEDCAQNFAPGTFGCHELLDRTILMAEMVEHSILSHPACAQNPEWVSLAEQAVAALNELYQKIGAEHLSDSEHLA